MLDLDWDLQVYGEEEGDPSMALHAIDVCKQNAFSELTNTWSGRYISRSFELLWTIAQYYTTVFKTTEYWYNLESIYKFIPYVCKALPGFNAMAGSDKTSTFHGYTKQS